ncbi:uncharacterized protein LOC129776568 [Toxorhynchites rutilus septentrionalis]|uniref:uncharacterized protein LOC129776568 n=1 Tax=Toxorhynchites rutilus septentrionalis TaxID=329112 RepID=UPI00247A5727|nr:uncharacterized protein LOC129776568 [Toxorhynchites rutilus septentrionalis]
MLLRNGIRLILLLMCVISPLEAAPDGRRSTGAAVTVIKGNENETFKSAKSLASSGRSKKASHKSTPITYITTLAETGHPQHYAKPHSKKSSKLVTKFHDDKEQHSKSKLKHHYWEKSTGKSLEVIPKKEPLDNPALLSKLGLGKLHISNSHHKKRLAVESRHHGRPDDSHMFVIKLPPNPYYYTNNGPVPAPNAIEDIGRKIPVGFKSNGKPGRIYHWNIPVLKKILGGNQSRSPNSRHHDNIDELIDIKDISTWNKPWENETLDKSMMKYTAADQGEKPQRKKTPTYYAPIKAKKSTHGKYYASNGKPQSFYVIEQSQKNMKPIQHHKLIS